jgi:rRNA biogenesis protein RRP5
MDSYPKRLDLWMVYVDMEAREGAAGATRVRALFNRILVQRLSSSTSLILSPLHSY